MEQIISPASASLTIPMDVRDAIYTRRSVRAYTDQLLSYEIIYPLLEAATQAPTAVDEQPWAFAVIEHKDILKRLSNAAKETMTAVEHSLHVPDRVMIDNFVPPDDIFYGAPALIVIYSKPMGAFVVADCWLAAENLILTACACGLGTCVIGLAVAVLNKPEWKKELGIASDMTAIAPIIVGFSSGITKPARREAPEIIVWK